LILKFHSVIIIEVLIIAQLTGLLRDTCCSSPRWLHLANHRRLWLSVYFICKDYL